MLLIIEAYFGCSVNTYQAASLIAIVALPFILLGSFFQISACPMRYSGFRVQSQNRITKVDDITN
jgi:hypothetical protein